MTRITQKSFTGGELSPALYSRNDLAKYSVGLKTLKNGFVRAEGCVSNRSGLELVCEVKNSAKKTRLIPFSFNTSQTYIIEVSERCFRFIKNGGLISENNSPVEVVTNYLENDIFNLKYAQNADVLTVCHKNYPPKELSRTSHYNWSFQNITFSPKISPPENVSAIWTGGDTALTTYKYLVTAVLKDTFEESNVSQVATVSAEMESYWGNNEYVTVSFSSVENAVEYNIYRSVNGIYGFIGTTKTTSFKDDKIEPDLTSTAPIFKNPFSHSNYPSCVNYFQQRKVYGALKNNPQQLVASQVSANDNFNISRPLCATDSVNITLAEREVNEIRHIIAMNDLILLTSGGEWKVNGSNGSFSPDENLTATPQSFYGCSDIAPVVSGNMILFVQSGGAVIRDLGYTYMSDSYDGDELSIFANHLFEGKNVVDMAYSKEPYRILWCVMSDGTLNALTYNKKQEISGWHRHVTKGFFESVAVVRENNEDVPYFVIKRTVNNQTKRFIERMASRNINNASDGVFLDCSLKYSGTPISTLTGLTHLENESVTILADGGVIQNKTVKNGSVTLDKPASKIVAGLPYEFELETLNIEGNATIGTKKIINRISVAINKSREEFFLAGCNNLLSANTRSLESINNSDLLFSKNIDVSAFSDCSDTVTIHIVQPYPLPLTINSISCDVTLCE